MIMLLSIIILSFAFSLPRPLIMVEYTSKRMHMGWRHQIETFSALLALCEGYLPVTGGFPSQRPVTRSFDVFFELRLNKRFSKQLRRRWFETPLRSLRRHCNCYVLLSFNSKKLPISYPPELLHWHWVSILIPPKCRWSNPEEYRLICHRDPLIMGNYNDTTHRKTVYIYIYIYYGKWVNS